MNEALKEWAAIGEAVGSGRQIALLRKGGIVEAAREGFQVRWRRFLLFPTVEHQHAELLQAGCAVAPAGAGIRLRVVAEVTDILRAPQQPEVLLAAGDEFIWNEAFVRLRYEYRPDLPLWLLLVRAAVLEPPVEIPDRVSYAGCKSWVNLTEDVDVAGAREVMEQDTYAIRRQRLLDKLIGSSHDLYRHPDSQ